MHRLIGVALALLLCAAAPGLHANGYTVELEMKKFALKPPIVTIKAGPKVRWVNREKCLYHSVWFEKLGEEASDCLFPADSLECQFDQAGSYPYRCGPHNKHERRNHRQVAG